MTVYRQWLILKHEKNNYKVKMVNWTALKKKNFRLNLKNIN